MQTTEEQNVIIFTNPKSNICINAAPGSGKTTTVIMRIVAMNTHFGIPLSEICLLTYNRFLANDMTEKLRHFGLSSTDMGWCGTIHAFCYRETRHISDLMPWVKIYEKQDECFTNFKYIIFDEYQDVDEEIAKVVEILARNKYLTIIGDERQQIYGYKGADANRLYSLRDDYIKLSLSLSFRCNREICKFLSRLYPSYPEIRSNRDGNKPALLRSKRGPMNNEKIIDKVAELVNRHKEGSIAIISPTIRSDASSSFLNDIHSNIMKRCKVVFDHNEEGNSNYKISSVHGVKGREFDTVIMLNVVDGEAFFDYPKHEALCKLFVGASRARKFLYIFEHLFGRGGSVGSLKWIADNDDCFDRPFGWKGLPEIIIEKTNRGKRRFKIEEFIRSLSSTDARKISEGYNESIMLKKGPGLIKGQCVTEIVENLLAMKHLGITNFPHFDIYITAPEWRELSQGKMVASFKTKVDKVAPCRTRIDYDWLGKSVKGVIVQTADDVVISYVDEKNIASTLICEEYYRSISDIKATCKELTTEISSDNIKRAWEIYRFMKLTKHSLTGYNLPDLPDDNIKRVLDYIQNESILPTPIKWKPTVKDYLTLPHTTETVKVEGNTTFQMSDGVLDVIYKDRITETDWLKMILYDRLQNETTDRLYIYNAETGELHFREKRS